jgi:uncharacterized protein YybS (DUF2232 family)
MQDNSRKITYGAMMIAIFAVLLAVSLYLPIIGSITMFFIPLPIILYTLKYDWTSSFFVIAVGIVLAFFIGGIVLMPIALVHGIIGFIMGLTIKTGKTKLYTFMATGLTLLIIAILSYIAAVFLFNFNAIENVLESLRTSQEQVTSIMTKYGELPESFDKQFEEMILFYEMAIPSFFIFIVFGFAFVLIMLNLPLVRRFGYDVERFPPFHKMKLPIITVWYYLLILFLPFIIKMEPGSTVNLVYINGMLVLRFLFLLQGLSLIHYYMKEMKSPKWVTVLSTILALLLNPITILLGVLDSGINIRNWIKNKKK